MESLEEKRIKAIAEQVPALQDELFLVGVRVKGNTGNQKVLIFIDGDEGINIDQCSLVNHQVGAIMEEQDFMNGKYLLEVSSPGLDHPLTLRRQYIKNKGRRIVVETLENEKLEGELKEVSEEGIMIALKNEEKEMKFGEINQSKIMVSLK